MEASLLIFSLSMELDSYKGFVYRIERNDKIIAANNRKRIQGIDFLSTKINRS
jgi:hypothetical protein